MIAVEVGHQDVLQLVGTIDFGNCTRSKLCEEKFLNWEQSMRLRNSYKSSLPFANSDDVELLEWKL
ncbi:hypothetical protein PPTG_22970 [Phytophthora nicotianae INRA-310]|uniref:Uncharacterized protein n=1 Tax=Phytophthora nicotianae (strain INRA-310) TaxID=761204 RepID=W2Q7F1_PHYN3|nr:hypothetical protein PPTG_22970 [Phytophthora nicotianae INRA-310]ETN08766.1 hypothetical protein PPTG_22970 [Phytophthora nicotianae INRA-310]